MEGSEILEKKLDIPTNCMFPMKEDATLEATTNNKKKLSISLGHSLIITILNAASNTLPQSPILKLPNNYIQGLNGLSPELHLAA